MAAHEVHRREFQRYSRLRDWKTVGEFCAPQRIDKKTTLYFFMEFGADRRKRLCAPTLSLRSGSTSDRHQSVESDTSRLPRIAHLNYTNSLEHFPDARRVFCRARNILEPGHPWIATGSTSDCTLVRPARIEIGSTSDCSRVWRGLKSDRHRIAAVSGAE